MAKKQQDERTRLVLNNPCAFCRAQGLPMPCKGHAKVGGGVSGGSSAESSQQNESSGITSQVSENKQANSADATIKGNAKQPHTYTKKFDGVIDITLIEKMLKNHMLTIESKPSMGILNFKFNSSLLSESQKKDMDHYLDAIIQLYHQFNHANNIADRDAIFKKDADGHYQSLTLTFPPNSGMQEKFILQLQSAGLLPENMKQLEKQNNIKNADIIFSPSPLHMKPSMTQSKKHEDEAGYTKQSGTKRKNPFNIGEGPTPKGK